MNMTNIITKDCQTHAERVVAVFTRADCWALALALTERYQNLTLAVLGMEDIPEDPEDILWCHMLVRDDRDPSGDTYVDVLGAHTFAEIDEQWEEHSPDFWDFLYPLETREEITAHVGHRERLCPEVTLDEGIDQILATGWTPPPARTH